MTRAIILAGGKGERLDPLTREIAKVLIPFRGRPLIDQSIDLYWKYNVYEIWLSLGYKWQDVFDKYRHLFPIVESKPLGTGGWLNVIKKDPKLLRLMNEPFFVNNGDNLLAVDLDAMMEQHKRSGKVVTIAYVPCDDVREYGALVVKNDEVTRFKEKQHSPKPKKGVINSGYYIFSPEIFKYVPDTQDPISLEKDIFPVLARQGKLGGFKVDNQWFDCGTFERYKNALEKWVGD